MRPSRMPTWMRSVGLLILVSLKIAHAQPHLIVSPPSINLFSDSAGTGSQKVTVSSSDGSPIYFTISDTAGGFFQVSATSPQTGLILTTPISLGVTCSCAGRASGTYSGSFTLSPPASNVVVPVNLTVGPASGPRVTSVLNGASFTNAPASPGEVLSIFGTGIGPIVPLTAKLDASGRISTGLGNVSVIFFNGGLSEYYAPLIYVSQTQINCVVPYEVASWSTAYVQVGYVGSWFIPAAPNMSISSTSPGVLTSLGIGTGLAAALNQDNTLNSVANPAVAGSTVQVFMTGEGQITPAGVTGSVTCSNGCATAAQIPKPLLPVTASVGGKAAAVTFSGEAPGIVSGVLQVNVTIPASTVAGQATLAVTIGSTASQPGVTIAVK